MDIAVRINDAQYADLVRFLGDTPKNVDRAAAAAINKTVATGATRIRREIARLLKAPVRRVGKAVRPLKTNAAELVGKVRLLNFNMPAIKTRLVPVKGGAYPLERIGSGVPLTNSPFKATMKSGHTGWFVRFGSKRIIDKSRMTAKSQARYGNKPVFREPIKEIFAPSPRKLWEEAPGLAAEQLSQLADVLEKNIQSQIDRFLAK